MIINYNYFSNIFVHNVHLLYLWGMKNEKLNPVQKREIFLIDVYNEFHLGRDAYNFKKAKRKSTASRLLTELRNRYNINQVIFKPHFIGSTVTAEMVTGNGKYSLD